MRDIHEIKSLISLILVALFSTHALADEPPKHNCKQPPVPGKFASDAALRAIERKTDIYKDCIINFADAQQEISKKTAEVAKANQAS
ncbi:hypothetical protein S2091_1357 [Solimicrobium silvestre]|uniref:Uncharacterized protein n=1 Tax=Solimicrobium silvestre TaxID=2099400 RepID=A0A2S9H2H7_9BURK|nr:hypothetical protein S2091_1357 [Solimicrobium silvestre]